MITRVLNKIISLLDRSYTVYIKSCIDNQIISSYTVKSRKELAMEMLRLKNKCFPIFEDSGYPVLTELEEEALLNHVDN